MMRCSDDLVIGIQSVSFCVSCMMYSVILCTEKLDIQIALPKKHLFVVDGPS